MFSLPISFNQSITFDLLECYCNHTVRIYIPCAQRGTPLPLQIGNNPTLQSLYTLSKFLITSDILRIPPYQRQYSWEQAQLSDLWNDLVYLENGKRYYFGQILLKRTADRETSMLSTFNVFEIVDGQQ